MKDKRIVADYGTPEAYDFYMKNCAAPVNMSRQTYYDILQDINSAAMECVLYENMELDMPRLGGIRIRRYKRKLKLDKNGDLKTINIPVDYKATKELWARDTQAKEKKKLIFNFNEHSNGFSYRFWWDKRTSNQKNQSKYYFRATRKNKRELAKIVKDSNIRHKYYD